MGPRSSPMSVLVGPPSVRRPQPLVGRTAGWLAWGWSTGWRQRFADDRPRQGSGQFRARARPGRQCPGERCRPGHGPRVSPARPPCGGHARSAALGLLWSGGSADELVSSEQLVNGLANQVALAASGLFFELLEGGVVGRRDPPADRRGGP